MQRAQVMIMTKHINKSSTEWRRRILSDLDSIGLKDSTKFLRTPGQLDGIDLRNELAVFFRNKSEHAKCQPVQTLLSVLKRRGLQCFAFSYGRGSIVFASLDSDKLASIVSLLLDSSH